MSTFLDYLSLFILWYSQVLFFISLNFSSFKEGLASHLIPLPPSHKKNTKSAPAFKLQPKQATALRLCWKQRFETSDLRLNLTKRNITSCKFPHKGTLSRRFFCWTFGQNYKNITNEHSRSYTNSSQSTKLKIRNRHTMSTCDYCGLSCFYWYSSAM